MANHRPIRRGRIPFRRRRPTRWIDCGSVGLLNLGPTEPGTPDIFVPGQLTGYGVDVMGSGGTGGATSGAIELLVGDGDTWWADANEVRLERVVGSIALQVSARALEADLAGNTNYWLTRMCPIVRFGLLVVAEEDEEVVALPPSLHESDDLEESQWLWLHQTQGGVGIQWAFENASDLYLQRQAVVDIPIDVRVKRKISRRDRLCLVHEYGWFAGAVAEDISASVRFVHQLRCLVSTK